MTVTVALAVTDPPPFVAVRVYVVERLGVTAFDVSEVTSPTP